MGCEGVGFTTEIHMTVVQFQILRNTELSYCRDLRTANHSLPQASLFITTSLLLPKGYPHGIWSCFAVDNNSFAVGVATGSASLSVVIGGFSYSLLSTTDDIVLLADLHLHCFTWKAGEYFRVTETFHYKLTHSQNIST